MNDAVTESEEEDRISASEHEENDDDDLFPKSRSSPDLYGSAASEAKARKNQVFTKSTYVKKKSMTVGKIEIDHFFALFRFSSNFFMRKLKSDI